FRDFVHPTHVRVGRELRLRPYELHRPGRSKGNREEDLNRPHGHLYSPGLLCGSRRLAEWRVRRSSDAHFWASAVPLARRCDVVDIQHVRNRGSRVTVCRRGEIEAAAVWGGGGLNPVPLLAVG